MSLTTFGLGSTNCLATYGWGYTVPSVGVTVFAVHKFDVYVRRDLIAEVER